MRFFIFSKFIFLENNNEFCFSVFRSATYWYFYILLHKLLFLDFFLSVSECEVLLWHFFAEANSTWKAPKSLLAALSTQLCPKKIKMENLSFFCYIPLTYYENSWSINLMSNLYFGGNFPKSLNPPSHLRVFVRFENTKGEIQKGRFSGWFGGRLGSVWESATQPTHVPYLGNFS